MPFASAPQSSQYVPATPRAAASARKCNFQSPPKTAPAPHPSPAARLTTYTTPNFPKRRPCSNPLQFPPPSHRRERSATSHPSPIAALTYPPIATTLRTIENPDGAIPFASSRPAPSPRLPPTGLVVGLSREPHTAQPSAS